MSRTIIVTALSVILVAASAFPAFADSFYDTKEISAEENGVATEAGSDPNAWSEDEIIASNPDEALSECEEAVFCEADDASTETGDEFLCGECMNTDSDFLYVVTEEVFSNPVYEDEREVLSDIEESNLVEDAVDIYDEQTYYPAKHHRWVIKDAVPGTCKTAGYTVSVICNECGAVYIPRKSIPPTGHTWSKWIIIKEVAGGTGHEETRRCMRCGEEEKRHLTEMKN